MPDCFRCDKPNARYYDLGGYKFGNKPYCKDCIIIIKNNIAMKKEKIKNETNTN